MYLSEAAKKFIISEVLNSEGKVDEYIIDTEETNVREKILYFEKALDISVNLDRLKNLKNSITEQLNKIAEDYNELTVDSIKNIFKVAQYLEVFIYLVDKNYYSAIKGSNKPLVTECAEEVVEQKNTTVNSLSIPAALNKLEIIDKKQYDNVRQNYRNVEQYRTFSHELKTYANVYFLRNKFSHSDIVLSPTQMWDYVKDTLVIYLNVAGNFKELIDQEINRINISNETKAKVYMDKFIKKYEERSSFNYITLEGKQRKDNVVSNSKTSLINIISKTPNAKIKLLGNAGMGKTSTILYLAYKDCKDFVDRVPIYIELKDVDEENSIMDLICSSNYLDCSRECVNSLMENGYINLYLDGINEVKYSHNDSLKKDIVKQINTIIASYPNIKLVISDRETNNITVTDSVASYIIEKLNDNKIEEFIRKNSSSQELIDKVSKLVDENSELKELVRVPFRLYKLIEIVKMGVSIPHTISEFDEYFTKAIIEREVKEKKAPEAKNLRYFIKTIMEAGYEKIDRNDLIEVISIAIKDRNLSDENSDKVIDLLLQLDILEEVEFEVYCFKNNELRQNVKTKEELEIIW